MTLQTKPRGGKIVSSSASNTHRPFPLASSLAGTISGPVSMAVQSYFQRCIHLGSRHFKRSLSRSFAGRFIITGIKSWEREGWRRNRLPIGLSFPLFSTCKINFDRSIGEILKGYCNKFVPDRLKSIAFSNHGFVIKRVNCFKEETFFSFSFAWIFIFQA